MLKCAPERSRLIRVAHIAPSILPVPPNDHGGTERVIHDLCVAMKIQGCDVTLFAASESTTPVKLVGRLPSLQRLEAEHGSVPPSIPSVLESVRMDEVRQRLSDFDILHFHGEFFHAALLGDQRSKSLTTIHWRVDELDRQLFFEAFPDLPVAAISASQQSGIPRANRAGVVLHGVAKERFEPCFAPGSHLAFIGRMTDQKRPDRAIEVAKRCGQPLKLAGTIDVGNPLYFDKHVRSSLGEGIDYVGPVGDVEKNTLLRNSTALLFPIDWPEPFGLVMIEAMACGTPVIAWNKGSVCEVIEDGVTGFIVENEDQAVEAVGRIGSLDRRKVRARFEQRFTSDRMAREYIDIYERMLSR